MDRQQTQPLGSAHTTKPASARVILPTHTQNIIDMHVTNIQNLTKGTFSIRLKTRASSLFNAQAKITRARTFKALEKMIRDDDRVALYFVQRKDEREISHGQKKLGHVAVRHSFTAASYVVLHDKDAATTSNEFGWSFAHSAVLFHPTLRLPAIQNDDMAKLATQRSESVAFVAIEADLNDATAKAQKEKTKGTPALPESVKYIIIDLKDQIGNLKDADGHSVYDHIHNWYFNPPMNLPVMIKFNKFLRKSKQRFQKGRPY
jgi:hypothetical protein